MLQYFAMERFLYRLAKSPFADRFVLKGALLLTAWRAPLSRPTMDIDLTGRTSFGRGDVLQLQPRLAGALDQSFHHSTDSVPPIAPGCASRGVGRLSQSRRYDEGDERAGHDDTRSAASTRG